MSLHRKVWKAGVDAVAQAVAANFEQGSDYWGLTENKIPIDFTDDLTPSMPTKASATLGAGVTVGVPSDTPHVFTTPAPPGQPTGNNYSVYAMVDFVGSSVTEIFTMVLGQPTFDHGNSLSIGVNRGNGDVHRYFRALNMNGPQQNFLLGAIGAGQFLPTFISSAQQGFGKQGGLPGVLVEGDGSLLQSIPPLNHNGSIYIRNKDEADHYEITELVVFQWRYAQFSPVGTFTLPDDTIALRSLDLRMSQHTEEGDSNLSGFVSNVDVTENAIDIMPFDTDSFVNIWGGSISIPTLGYKGTIIGWSTDKIWLLEQLPADVGDGQHVAAFHFPAATPIFTIDDGVNQYPIRTDRNLVKTFADYNARAIIPPNALFATRMISVSGGEAFNWMILMDNREGGPSVLPMFALNPRLYEVELEYETSKAHASSSSLTEAEVVP